MTKGTCKVFHLKIVMLVFVSKACVPITHSAAAAAERPTAARPALLSLSYLQTEIRRVIFLLYQPFCHHLFSL